MAVFAGRLTSILIAALMLVGPASASEPAAPVEGEQAPAAPATFVTLPPAQIDNSLNVGGQDVKAREIETRLSIPVMLNGRGPYRFIVDSGADSSAVGERIARELQLPLAPPAILHAMSADNIVVSRVKVD